jgi:hypothetical protein
MIYQAPSRDYQFVIKELLGLQLLRSIPNMRIFTRLR